MYNLIWADLFKLRKSMAMKISFGITTISAVAMAVIAYMIPQGNLDADIAGMGFMFSDINMMSIIGALIAGVFICGDFENKTIHDAIANGRSRGGVIVNKAIVFFCAIVVLLLPYAIITGISLSTGFEFSMGSVAVGFLNILTSGAGTVFSATEIGKLLAIVLTLIFVYMAQLSVCIPLAFVLKKPVLVVALYYALTILGAVLTGFRGKSLVFDGVFACTPFGGGYTLMTLNTETGDIFKAISVSLIFMIAMLVVTYGAFRKSEIK